MKHLRPAVTAVTTGPFRLVGPENVPFWGVPRQEASHWGLSLRDTDNSHEYNNLIRIDSTNATQILIDFHRILP
jgi:hypothetical protein